MTLATKLWITSPLTHAQREELWQRGRELIYQFSSRPGPAEYTDKACAYTDVAPGTRDRDHIIGQGFCSMYDFAYHPLGLQAHPAQEDPHDPKWCEDPCTDPHKFERIGWYVQIDLDTSYGFQVETPAGTLTCSHLHALILYSLGSWLHTQNVSWAWYNEYTGEISSGLDTLYTLVSFGKDATDWFHNIVQPVFDAEAAVSGAEIEWH
jgi:hypothetical protein